MERAAGAGEISQPELRRVAGQLLQRRAGRLDHLATIAVVGVVSLLAADSIAGMGNRPPKPLLLVVALAGASILLSIRADQLFLSWLFLAPLLQESASKSHLGHPLSLALYTVVPLVFLVKLLTTHGSRPRRRWFDTVPALYALFIVASLAITATGELKTGTTGTVRTLYQNVLIGVIVYYVVAFWRGAPLSVVRVARVVLVAAALQAVIAVIELGTGWNPWHDTTWQQAGDVRSIATLSNPSLTGAFIGVGIVVALAVLAWQGPSSLRALAVVMVVVGVPGLYATKTRGPILGTAVAASLCLLLSARSRLVGIGVIALVALTLVAFWPQIRASSVYQSRINQQQNIQARLVLQDVSLRLAEKKPVLGWGYDSFDRVKYDVSVQSGSLPVTQALQSTSHDTFLTMLVEYGAVGLLLFLLPWVVIVWRAVNAARSPAPAERWFFVAGIASIGVIAISGAALDFRFYSFVPMLAWLFLGLLRRQEAESI